MNVEDIFDKMINSWFAKKITRKKVNYLSDFYESQLYKWINDDKNWLKHLIEAEKQVEKSSKHFIWKKMSHPFWEYSVTSYFVNFQYFVELINVHGEEIWFSKDIHYYANDWWEDLYVSLRLSLMWHYKSSFFHLRSFMENYFMMVWEYSIEHWKIDLESNAYKRIWKHAVTRKFKYLTSSEKNKKLAEHDIDLDYLFDGEEFSKIYDYLSKITHNKTNVKTDYSKTIAFDEDMFDKYLMLSWLVMLLTIRLVYWFTEKSMEKQWLHNIQKPISWSPSYYRRIIWEMIHGDMFYDLYENKHSRNFFKNEVKIDAEKLYPRLKETIKDMKMYDKLRKEAKWDHDKYMDLVYEWKTRNEK